MLIHIPEVGVACLECEQCRALVRLPKKVPIIDVWRAHARVCRRGCPMPPATTAYLKATRLAA